MKKLGKLFLVILLSLTIITSLPISVFAYEYGTPDLDEMIQIETNGHTKIYSINKTNINRIKNSRSRKYKNKSDKQKLKEIFDALDFNINDLQFEEISKELNLSHISDISVETQYVKIDADGKNSYISEDEALEIVEKEKILSASSQESYSLTTTSETSDTSPTTGHSSPPEPVADGCMEMQITKIYTPNYNGTGTTIGRYCFLGSCVWLTTPSPLKRTVNAICFYSPDFAWANKILDPNEGSNYISYFSYDVTDHDGYVETITKTKYDQDAVVSSAKGVFFEYKLPSDFLNIYDNFNFLLFAVGKVQDSDNIIQELRLDLKYTFLNNPLSISPSLSWGLVGVSASFLNDPEEYCTYYSWPYETDYYT